jgi:hypothetical protein
MAPSSSAGVATVSSLDTLLSQLLSPQRIRSYFLNNPKGRYALAGTIAAIIAAIAEHKRRSDNRDEVKRKVPHRRNSAVHLYDGSSVILKAKSRFIRDIRTLQKHGSQSRHQSYSSSDI